MTGTQLSGGAKAPPDTQALELAVSSDRIRPGPAGSAVIGLRPSPGAAIGHSPTRPGPARPASGLRAARDPPLASCAKCLLARSQPPLPAARSNRLHSPTN